MPEVRDRLSKMMQASMTVSVDWSSRMVNYGANWSQIGWDDEARWDDGAKRLKMWWPGTELNRRRQPFQGYILL
jgi:hypothetical protein